MEIRELIVVEPGRIELQEKTSVRLGEIIVLLEILDIDTVATKLEEYHEMLAVERAMKD